MTDLATPPILELTPIPGVTGVADSPDAPDPTALPPTNPQAGRVHRSLAAAALRVLAESLTDFERIRIATDNRLRALRQVYGIPDDATTPEVVRLQATSEGLAALEHQAELDLARVLRTHPLGGWVKRTLGIGEKQGARLIAAIGDPAWHTLEDRPRTLAELRAWCGYHVLHPSQGHREPQGEPAGVDPLSNPAHGTGDSHTADGGVAASRRKGQKANWSSEAKMRLHLCAEAAIKAGVRSNGADDTDGYNTSARTAISPYGKTYLDGRHKYATAVHNAPCLRCGPKGKPAPTGSPLSAGHQHARALRLVVRHILADLHTEASGEF